VKRSLFAVVLFAAAMAAAAKPVKVTLVRWPYT
jgi:hypothetical protein